MLKAVHPVLIANPPNGLRAAPKLASTALATFAIQSGRTELGLAELEASQTHLDWLFVHRPDLQGLTVIQAHRDKLRSAAGPTASGR